MELKSFVKEVVARIKGDDDNVVAERNFRKAKSAIKGQLASLDAKKVDAEIALEEAKEKLEDAKYPTNLIEETHSFLNVISTCQRDVESAKENIEDIDNSIKYFTNLYE